MNDITSSKVIVDISSVIVCSFLRRLYQTPACDTIDYIAINSKYAPYVKELLDARGGIEPPFFGL